MDNGSFTALVSLDISAACDVLDHSVLSSRLQSDFSIDGIALYGVQSGQIFLPFCHNLYALDRRRDRQTDGHLSHR